MDQPMNDIKAPSNKHNMVYTALLIAMAFFYSLGAMSMWFISHSPEFPTEARWAFEFTVYAELMYVVAMVVTLILRGVAPGAGHFATLVLNIILLPLIPLGTALGIYGLWKVDKVRPPTHLPG
jgi:uncharacterized membrane protein YhdT